MASARAEWITTWMFRTVFGASPVARSSAYKPFRSDGPTALQPEMPQGRNDVSADVDLVRSERCRSDAARKPRQPIIVEEAARVCLEGDTCELSFTFAFAVVKSLSASVLVA